MTNMAFNGFLFCVDCHFILLSTVHARTCTTPMRNFNGSDINPIMLEEVSSASVTHGDVTIE